MAARGLRKGISEEEKKEQRKRLEKFMQELSHNLSPIIKAFKEMSEGAEDTLSDSRRDAEEIVKRNRPKTRIDLLLVDNRPPKKGESV